MRKTCLHMVCLVALAAFALAGRAGAKTTSTVLPVVAYADSAVMQSETWGEWQIPMAEFAGVDFTAIETMAIGLGDRNASVAGGMGLVYIDDIGRGHPADTE